MCYVFFSSSFFSRCCTGCTAALLHCCTALGNRACVALCGAAARAVQTPKGLPAIIDLRREERVEGEVEGEERGMGLRYGRSTSGKNIPGIGGRERPLFDPSSLLALFGRRSSRRAGGVEVVVVVVVVVEVVVVE